MMVNMDQLKTSITTLPSQPQFKRHVTFGIIAVLLSFVIVQQEPHDASSGIKSFILYRFLSSTLSATARVITSLWTLILRITGIALGVGLGLGLAGHIYDTLEDMHRHKNTFDNNLVGDTKCQRSYSVSPKIPPSPYTTSEDPNSYHSLMRSAGYHVDDVRRGQMVRGERATLSTCANGVRSIQPGDTQQQQQQQQQKPSIYKFNKGETGYTKMKSMWPNLAPVINESLAKLTEFVLRDYVASWYGKIDENVPVEITDNEVDVVKSVHFVDSANVDATSSGASFEKQERRMTLPNPDVTVSTSLQRMPNSRSLRPPPSPHLSKSLPLGEDTPDHQPNRTMVLTTVGTLPSPFIESLYTCFAYLLGTLATRASENVNVLELLLLHLPHVLGKNLATYRELKGVALEKKRRREAGDVSSGNVKPGSRRGRDGGGRRSVTASSLNGNVSSSSISQQSSDSRVDDDEVSEIAIVREYLLAGRLHKAITFGLDVPSLLFADPSAKECPPSASFKDIEERLKFEEDSVLEDRLLSSTSTLVAECELDYNRVMASKIAKLVVPKNEMESSVVKTMMVEMLASCVLMPVMGCFIPDSVNGWIITGLQTALAQEEADNTTTETEAAAASMAPSQSNHSLDETNRSLDGTNRSLVSFSEGNDEEDMNEILGKVLGDSASEVLGEGSITSDLDDMLFDDNDSKLEDPTEQLDSCAKSEQLINLLSMSIIELRNFIDFDDFRAAKEHNQDIPIDWDNHRSREAVRHLVLVIEAALLLGSRPERKRSEIECETINDLSEMVEATLEGEDTTDGDDFEVNIGVVSESRVPFSRLQEHNSISSVLMELTGDIDAFEKVVDTEYQVGSSDDDSIQAAESKFTPKPSELSTLRTLIAAWLHTGQAFRVLSIISKSYEAILRPFYYKDAFMRRGNYIGEFTTLLSQLDGIEILVDTTAVLASRCLLMTGSGLETFERQMLDTIDHESSPKTEAPDDIFGSTIFKQVGTVKANFVQNRDRLTRLAQSATETFTFGKVETDSNSQKYHHQAQGTPAYLQFDKNSVLASSLRSERQRRINSWHKETRDKEKIEMVCRSKGANEKDALLQRELHHLARFFYSNTNEVMIEPCSAGDSDKAANVMVKSIAPPRKIEVPDEDSSFLLRAQPRSLKPVAIHRDQKVANLACKIYVAMYEEPAIHPKTRRYYGGRYLRQCLLKYYPNDKTASVSIANDLTVLDRRIGQPSVKHILTEEFQNTRHSCLRVATSSSLLNSPLMEPNDFSASPRAGKAVDFIYRASFFVRPVLELNGKRFVIHDASALLHHRASASSMELSDASLTAAIIIRGSSGLNVCKDRDSNPRSFSIKISDDGSPLVLLRANTPGKEHGTKEEARPYRPSFIRAALLVKSSRQEAQIQCLSYCIRSGSARSSSKIKSDHWLQPTLNLLHYANSHRKEEQFLLRDLQFGMNHIDRAQLCRTGLLNPRYPTVLRGLTVKVVGAVEVRNPSNVDLLGAPTLILYKIRCTAIAEFVGEDDSELPRSDGSKSKSRYFREEWTVSRSLRDFTIFHKHIKSQVAQTEYSASTGAKLVGAATAALTIVGGSQVVSKKERGPLIPSLSKATQVGTLGLSSKRVVDRRKKLLDEYLKYLTAPNNMLSRCPELLKFLGAYTSIFPPVGDECLEDEFGREDVSRVELDTDKLKAGIVHVKPQTEQRRLDATPKKTNKSAMSNSTGSAPLNEDDTIVEAPLEPVKPVSRDNSPQMNSKKQPNLTRRMAMIRSQEVNLRDVRRSAFRLLSDLFDLDSASFFRSRVISVIKTMSLAFTNAQDFHLMLFKCHVKYMNGEWVAGWIFHLIDMFWPNGVFYTRGPDLTKQEQLELKQNSKKMLEQAFPLQLKTVLGRHSDEGLDLLHEMLQNRLVCKSIAYMLLDSVWTEIFPELMEFATGASCLDKDF